MEHKIDIWHTNSYGYYEIRFRKVFNLPFVPFIGLTLSEGDDDYELDVELVNNDYTTTRIFYHVNRSEFEVNIRSPWRHPVTDETIDSLIETFEKAGWQRRDHTDIQELKSLMNREYQRLTKTHQPG